jgi:hypothetical protein
MEKALVEFGLGTTKGSQRATEIIEDSIKQNYLPSAHDMLFKYRLHLNAFDAVLAHPERSDLRLDAQIAAATEKLLANTSADTNLNLFDLVKQV